MVIASYRVTKFAFQNFWRNFWLSVITISMLVLTLLTINILLIINIVTDSAISFVEDRIEVSVYLHEHVDDDKAAATAAHLKTLTQVKSVNLITADSALERFKERHNDDAGILDALDEVGGNPFGPSLIVTAQSSEDFDFIIEALEDPRFSEDIRYKDFTDVQDTIERIKNTTDKIRIFGFILAAVFFFIAMLIIFNTVRMGIFIHREEISIMKLVGASNWFVRAPFILEIILYSLIATVIVAAIILPIVAILEPKFVSFFGNHPVGLVSYFELHLWKIFGIEFLGIVLVSIIATGMAMRRYLRV